MKEEFFFTVRLDAEPGSDETADMLRDRLQTRLSRACYEIAGDGFCVGWSSGGREIPLAARCAHCGDFLTADQAWGHNCGGPSRVPGLSPEALSAEFDKWWVRHEPAHSDGQRPAFMDGYRLGLNALNAAVRSLPPEAPKPAYLDIMMNRLFPPRRPLHLVVVVAVLVQALFSILNWLKT